MDFVACEPQFIDHAAPVWHALGADVRGRFLTEEHLLEHAAARGIAAEAIDPRTIRAGRPPRANPGEGPTAFVVSIGDTKVARRLGYRRFAFMEHGAGQAYLGGRGIAHPSYAGGADREDTSLFLVPNDYSADLWRRAYPDATVEVVGCPRLDTLPAREPGPAPVVAISFHWPSFVAPEAGNALGHYLRALPALAARFHVIGHAHPKGDWPVRMARIYRKAGITFVPDFDDVSRQADVYVCDNSSTLFEFAATGRPVVVLNAPQFRRNVNHGGRFWDWAGVGVQVNEPVELVPAVEEALADRAEIRERRDRVLDLVYAHRTGAPDRAAAAIARWAGVGAEVAA